MRILHVITRLIAGGAQINTLRTAAQHRRVGIDAHILCGPSAGAREGSLVAAARAASIPLHELPTLGRDPSLSGDLTALLGLRRFLQRESFDVVHTHTSKAGFIGRLAARLAGVPTIVHTPHGHVFHSYYGALTTRAYMLLERCAAGWADRLVALTPSERDEHLALGIATPEQFSVIPSGIDVERFRSGVGARAEARSRLGLPLDALVIGCVGRLVPVKGQDVLIAAMSRVVQSRPDAALVLAGDGDCRETLQAAAARLGLARQVHFTGRLEHPEFLYPAFSLAVVPSRNEGMGRVALEAMAAGIPVVASAVGGLIDLADGGRNAVLVPAGDPTALAGAIVRLSQHPETAQAMARAAQAAVEVNYSERHMADSLEALYRSLCPVTSERPARTTHAAGHPRSR